ncbi:MAG: ATP-binding protein, partial [Desulfobulbaceae bacterium]|nr:ATP-binding protein [Desulfobulbaceae bacterium]
MNSQILNHDARPSTLLVVDDDQALRDLVRVKMMKRGYKVFTASDGLTAFELLEANWVDLILLDQNMPESEGLEVFREMRIRWPQLPVVMVTAHGSKHLIKDFLLSGGRDFMEKPIVDFQAFDFRIKRVLLEVARERTAGKALREAIAREESQKAVNVLLTSMSHEIRTPLNSVQTMAYLLGQCGLPGKQNEYVTTISKAVRDLLSLLDNILDFSSVEVGEFALDKKSFNLEDLLRNTYESFSERLGLKGLSFTARIAPEVPIFLIGDPRSLGQTLVSLIDNAIKFTEHGGVEVSVTLLKAERERLSLEFSVTDTGIGMTRLECEKIFNPFTQLDSSNTRSYGGVGIGLALCKKIVELMGGGIEVESQPGRGSVFRFSLDLEPDPFQRSQGEY